MKRTAIITGGTLLLLGLCWLGGAARAALPDAERALALPSMGERERVWTESYPMLPGGTLSVENELGPITLEGWDNPDIEVTVTLRVTESNGFLGAVAGDWLSPAAIRRLLDDAPVDTRYCDGTLQLNVDRRQAEEPVMVLLHVRAPRQSAVRLDTEHGRISVCDIEGTVDVASGNGALELARVVGDVAARTHNGRIALSEITGSVDAQSGNGAVTCEDADGSVSLRSRNGGIDARRNRGPVLACRTDNGSIAVSVPPREPHALVAVTQAGKVRCRVPLDADALESPGMVQGTLHGGGNMLSLRSNNGSITIAQD